MLFGSLTVLLEKLLQICTRDKYNLFTEELMIPKIWKWHTEKKMSEYILAIHTIECYTAVKTNFSYAQQDGDVVCVVCADTIYSIYNVCVVYIMIHKT